MVRQPKSFFSFCPQCGSQALVAAEEESTLCKQCNFHLFFNVATAVSACVVNQKGELLLVQRGRKPGKGLWDIPGGFMNPGESAEETAQREVLEEVGITIEHIQYFASAPNVYHFNGVDYPIADFAFLATTADTPLPQDDEVIDARFFIVNEIDLKTIAFPSIRTFIALFQQLHK